MAIRPTFMGFETSTRGLQVNQKALDIVGNNIGNIGVTGYTRQRADQISLSINARNTRYSSNRIAFAGQGAATYGVSQIRDSFLDKRFRQEYADVGYYSTTSAVLEDLASALDEIVPSDMSSAMQYFEQVWNEMLSASTNEVNGINNVLAAAKDIVAVFNQMSAKVDNVWSQQQYNLELEVADVNKILAGIAELNDEIRHQSSISRDPDNGLYMPLELQDQRNVLLDELAGKTGIYYQTEADGTVTVWAGTKDGEPIVKGDTHQTLKMATNENDPAFKTVRLYWNESGDDLRGNNSGSLQGSLDMLNGRGLVADGKKGENHSQGILYYKDKINQFAVTFADAFNHVVEYAQTDPLTGELLYDADGNPLAYDPPRYRAMFSFNVSGDENAATIQINKEWEDDAEYLIKDVLLKLEGGGKGDNSYAAQVIQKFKETLDFGEFRGSVHSYIEFYSNTKLGNDKSASDTRLKSVSTVADNLLDQIQQISGVSLDEEGVDMMQYQKAYDAMSRVFTTLDEMLDKLINSTGVVGR